MNEKNRISINDFQIVYFLIVLLIVLGTFFDFDLSSYVYNEKNILGILGFVWGDRPSDFCFSLIGALLLGCKADNETIKRVDNILGIVFIAIGTLMSIIIPIRNLSRIGIDNFGVIVIIVAIVLHGLIVNFVYKNTKDQSHKDVVKVALAILGVVALTALVVQILKIVWSRPRMRLIKAIDIPFSHWHKIGNILEKRYLAIGIKSDEFKSFPSGHTASAANLFVFTLLPFVNTSLFKHQKKIFYISLVFTLIVGFSRIIMGAHFLTDISFGFLISFTAFVVAYKILEKKNR